MVYSAAIKNIIRIIIIALAFGFGSKASAQLLIDNTMTPEQLVQNILIGSGVTVSNITFTGNQGNAICAFTNGNSTVLGLDEGVI